METSGSFDQLIKKVRSFSEQTWQTWIWERCHGQDSITQISVVRDPNPEQVVIDAFWQLSAHGRARFVEALLNSTGRSLDSYRQVFSSGRGPIFDEELLALERHLRIALGVDITRLRSKAKTLGREIFSLAMLLPHDQAFSLRPLALSFRSRSGDRLSNRDLEAALGLGDSYVEAFRHAVEQSTSAVGMYFPKFIETATKIGRRVAIKTELLNLLHRFGANVYSRNYLSTELNEVLFGLSKEHKNRLADLFSELNIPTFMSRPIKQTLETQREGNSTAEIVYADFNYVRGDGYRLFNEAILRYLADNNKAITVKSARATSWDMAAFNLLLGLYAYYSDPYYMTGPRSLLVDIVQFGWVYDFTCVVDGNSHTCRIINKYLENKQTSFAHIIKDCVRVLSDLEVGLLGDTAASTEVHQALTNDFHATERLVTQNSPASLLYWLKKDPKNRIVICDHGVARDIQSATKEQMRLEGLEVPDIGDQAISWIWGKDGGLVFKYSTRIPVGIVYPKQDIEWSKEIEKALKKTMVDFGSDHWDQISNELANAGITAFSKAEFQELLGITPDHAENQSADGGAISTGEGGTTVVPFKRKTG